MKRTLTLSIALLTLLVLGGCSNEYSKEQLVERGGLIYEVNSQIPFTGSNEWFYEDGQLQRKRNYKDGKEDGLYESYHENGQLKSKRNYKDGKEEGLSENYDENGKAIPLNSE